jgi:hypothetical protein
MVVIDCTQEPSQCFSFASEKFDEALEMRAEMFEGDSVSRQLQDFAGVLKKDFDLGEIKLDEVIVDTNHEDDTHKKSLFLKKLAKVCLELSQNHRGDLLSGLSVELVPKGVEVDREANCWRLCWNFDDSRLLKKLSRPPLRKQPGVSQWSP